MGNRPVTAEEESKQGKIENRIDRLGKSLEGLHKKIGILEERLAPCLEDEPAPPACSEAQGPSPVKMVNDLRALEDEIDRASGRLLILTDRIEL